MISRLLAFALLAPYAWGGEYPVLRAEHPFPYSRFFVPNGGGVRTSVVMLHGSEGGSVPFLESEAAILAGAGYAVLTLCYFDCGRGLAGTRQTLKDVEATVVLDAVKWLRSLPQSDGRVIVYGFSRGGELALIAGSAAVTPEETPDALIAHAPSDLYRGPFNWSWRDAACWVCAAGPGRCAPSTPRAALAWNPGCGPDDEQKIDHNWSAWRVRGDRVWAGTRIEVERFAGPVLITVGEQDSLWPADQTRRIEQTLRASGRDVEVHYFPEADHVFGYIDENRRRKLALDFINKVSAIGKAPAE
nr:alpha/beta fold hydrolase [Acidobacteriota bacterium]